MAARKPKGQRYTAHELDGAIVAGELRDVMPIGDGAVPHQVIGWFHAGQVRKIRADYPNGWRLQFSVSPRGTVGRVRATLHLRTEAKGA